MRRVLWSWNRPRKARKWDKSSLDCGYWTHRKMKSNHLRNNQHHHCYIVAFVWPIISISLVSETLAILEGGLSRTPLTCKLESLLLIRVITDATSSRFSTTCSFRSFYPSLLSNFFAIMEFSKLRNCSGFSSTLESSPKAKSGLATNDMCMMRKPSTLNANAEFKTKVRKVVAMVLAVLYPNAIDNPHIVMVHLQYASPINRAVMAPGWFKLVALLTKPDCFTCWFSNHIFLVHT